jgi:predicted metal-dependent hydrolase
MKRYYFWITKKRKIWRTRKGPNRQKYLETKEVARMFVKSRLEHWNQYYKFKYGRVSIRNQRSRWGSCSKNGNLNFNFRISELPSHLADYIIVHELCHIGEFNHSQKFWNLVGQTIPNHLEFRKELKKVRMN